MTRSLLIALSTTAFGLGGCMMTTGEHPATTASTKYSAASTRLLDATGATKGSAKVSEMGDGIHVEVDVTGMAPGTYGVHLHQIGACTAPDFTSAGPHWNPTSKQHGRDNPMGAHNGDLPNLEVGADGAGHISAHVPGKLEGPGGLLDNESGAVVVHAKPDDYKTDPSGDSGPRIACGALA